MPDQPATPAKSTSGTFGFLTKKIGGVVPVWVILVAAVAVWYWYFHYGPGATKTPATTPGQGKNGGDQIVNVRLVDDDGKRTTGPGPTPGQHGGSTKLITIERDMTLQQAAGYYHWTPETLQDIEQMNAQQYHGHLTGSTQLHKGDQILRPIGDHQDDSGDSRWRNQ